MRYLPAAVVFLIAVFTTGCNTHRSAVFPNVTGDLIVTVTGDASLIPALWVVVDNADGTRVLDARQVTGEGEINFGDTNGERVTINFLGRDQAGNAFVNSYVNALGGNWIFERNSPPPDSLGSAQITVHLQPGIYQSCHLELPFGVPVDVHVGVSDSQLVVTVPVAKLETDNHFSVLAVLAGPASGCGWLTDQPFQLGEVNAYDLFIDHTALGRYITSTRPLDVCDVDGFRSSACVKYNLESWSSGDSSAQTNVPVVIPPFPITRSRISGAGNGTSDSYYYEYASGDIPSVLPVPTGTISGTFLDSMPRFTGISINGQSDAVTGLVAYTDGSIYLSWTVTVSPATSEINLPTIPDSILNDLRPTTLWLWAAGCQTEDFDAADDYDGYIRLIRSYPELRSPDAINQAYGSASDCLYNTYYEDFVQLWPASNSPSFFRGRLGREGAKRNAETLKR